MTINQKNTIEILKENLERTLSEKKETEKKYDTLKIESEKNNEMRMQDRLRMESVITFCGLMDNCTLSPEANSKMGEVPTFIANYLKGGSKSISPKKPEIEQRRSNPTLNKFLGAQEGVENEKNIKLVVNELTDIKDSVDILKSAISRMIQNSDANALNIVEEGSPNSYIIPRDLDRSRGFVRSRDLVRSKDLGRSKDLESSKDLGRSDFDKQRGIEIQKEIEEQRDLERQKELEKRRELVERQKVMDNQKEFERLKELDRQKEFENRQKEFGRLKELDRQKELDKQKEFERLKELDRQKEMEKHNQKQRLRSENEDLAKKKKSTICTGKGRLCKEIN